MKAKIPSFLSGFWTPTVLLGFLGAVLPFKRFWNFQIPSVELTSYLQNLWVLIHSPQPSILGSFFFWPIVPVFVLFPRAEILLFLQPFVLASGGTAIASLSEQYLQKNHWITMMLPFLYWWILGAISSSLPAMNPEIWMIPLFFWAIVGLQSEDRTRRWVGGVFFAFALATTRFSVVLAATIGLIWWIGFSPEKSRKWTKFLGKLIVGFSIIVSFFSFPIIFKWSLVVPGLGFVLIWIGISFIKSREKPFPNPVRKKFFYLLGFSTVSFWCGIVGRSWVPDSEHSKWLRQTLDAVNYESSVAASDFLVPYLAFRKEVLSVAQPFDSVACIVLDPQADLGTAPRGEQLLDLGYHEVWSCKGFKVFEKGLSGCLRTVPVCN